jgi:hypothetical protein
MGRTPFLSRISRLFTRKTVVPGLIFLMVLVLSLLLSFHVQALPEYASQTGEPCATCHNSPSGGGARSVRGLAWTAAQKPGTVPGLADALKQLGVTMKVDPAQYAAPKGPFSAAKPLQVNPVRLQSLGQWLAGYGGN